MRRIALIAAAGLACGGNMQNTTPGPLDRFTFPTGLAVLPVPRASDPTLFDHRLLVASSNADLTYASETGGSVIAVDPEAQPVSVVGALDIRSFSGELALADTVACPALKDHGRVAAAVVPIRGEDVVYRLDVGPEGSVSCAPSGCVLPVGNTDRGDPWSTGVACDTATSPGGALYARAYVGYLRETDAHAWLTQIDLLKSPGEDGYVQHAAFQFGQIRGMAYDSSRRRLYLTHTVVGATSTLMYYDLANGCRIDVAPADGGCPRGQTPDRVNNTAVGAVPVGLELRGIALAHEVPGAPVRRAYVSARIYDAAASQSAGGRVGDFDGLLLVVDLAEDASGGLVLDVVDELPIGYGAADVRVLPQRFDPITGAPRPDVVAALAADDGVVWIYDDETGARVAIGRSPKTGAPSVGPVPWGLAVDPEVLPGTNVARVYAGSFQESFVTPIDVPLDDPGAAAVAVDASLAPRRIGPGVP